MHSNEDYYKVLVNRKTRSISFELITVTFVLLKYSNGEKVPYAVICSFVPLALQTEDTFVSLSYLSKNLKQEEVGHGSHSHNLSSFLLFFFSIVLYFIVLLKKKIMRHTTYTFYVWINTLQEITTILIYPERSQFLHASYEKHCTYLPWWRCPPTLTEKW